MRWAEHWVFLFPLWHGTMPALFKGFLGHIFRPGFAMGYKKKEKGFPRRPLAGIYEKQNWRASFPSGGIGAGPTPANPTDHRTTFKAKASYMYQRKYRGTLTYSSTSGNADPGRYAPAPVTGSANGYPDSRGLIFELDYLPHPQVKLALQYTRGSSNSMGRTLTTMATAEMPWTTTPFICWPGSRSDWFV